MVVSWTRHPLLKKNSEVYFWNFELSRVMACSQPTTQTSWETWHYSEARVVYSNSTNSQPLHRNPYVLLALHRASGWLSVALQYHSVMMTPVKSAEGMSGACWGLKSKQSSSLFGAAAGWAVDWHQIRSGWQETPALISAEWFGFAFQRAAGCQCLEVSTVQYEMRRCGRGGS